MNSLNFTGGLGRDAETRFTPSGDAITSFSVALTSGYGEKKITTWLNCSLFGKRAESLSPYLKKGAPVYIEGRIQTRKWQDKEGNDRYTTEIIADQMQMLGIRSQSSDVHDTRTEKKSEHKNDGTGFDGMEDDIPFINIYRGRRAYVI